MIISRCCYIWTRPIMENINKQCLQRFNFNLAFLIHNFSHITKQTLLYVKEEEKEEI